MKKAIAITFAVIGGALVILLGIGLLAGPAPAPAPSAPPVPAASWHVAVFHEVTNPATLLVNGFVTNTGATAGTPVCDISASDPGGAYTGSDTITAKNPIRPGRKTYFSDSIIITNQGARYVTTVTMRCHS